MVKEGGFDEIRKDLIEKGLLREGVPDVSKQKKSEIADDDYVGALAIFCTRSAFHPPTFVVDPIEGGKGFWSGVTIEKIKKKKRGWDNKEFYGNRGIGNTPDTAKNDAAKNLLQYMVEHNERGK